MSDWDAYAADPAQALTNSLGETYYASGFNWFVSCNQQANEMGDAQVDDAPTDPRPAAPNFSSLTVDASPGTGSQITYPSGEFDPDLRLVLRVEMANSTGQQVSGAAIYTVVLDPSPPAATLNIQSELEAVYGLVLDNRAWFAFLHAQDEYGQRSAPAELRAITT